jgi:hypothetical protein
MDCGMEKKHLKIRVKSKENVTESGWWVQMKMLL